MAIVLINYKPKYQSRITEVAIGLLLCVISTFVLYYWQIKLLHREVGVDFFQEIILEIWTIPAICGIAILSYFISLKWPSKITAITGSITAVLLGYLIATPITFWLTNLDDYNPHWQRVVLNVAFSPLYIRDEIYPHSFPGFAGNNNYGELFAAALNKGGIDFLLKNWWHFIRDAINDSYVLLFAILGIILAKTNIIRVSIILLIACGLGMSLVMSARHVNSQYLIFQEIFLIIAGSLGLGERIASRGSFYFHKYEIIIKQFALIGIVMIILSFAGKNQIKNTREMYNSWNGGYRNWITIVNSCVFSVQPFTRDMKSIYGSNENIVRRIIEDKRLNGSDRGIDILNLPKLRDHLSNAKIDLNY